MDKLEKPLSFKKKCELVGVSYASACKYRKEHDGITDDDVINYYLHMKQSSFSKETLIQKCKRLGISKATYLKYRKLNPDKNDEEIIEICLEISKKFKNNTLAKLCRQHGFSPEVLYKFRKEHCFENLTNEELIDRYIKHNKSKEESLTKMCERLNLNYATVQSYKTSYKGISNAEAVELYLKNRDKITFKELCAQHNLSYGTSLQFRRKHPDLSDEEVILELTKPKEVTFADKCRAAGITDKRTLQNIATFRTDKRNRGLTDEQVIDKYKTNVINHISFKELCNKAGVNHLTAIKYKSMHHELTDEQIIIYYRPDCYINWLGELVIPT